MAPVLLRAAALLQAVLVQAYCARPGGVGSAARIRSAAAPAAWPTLQIDLTGEPSNPIVQPFTSAEFQEQLAEREGWRARIPGRRTILAIVACLALAAAVRPLLVAQVLYVGSGVSLGYGSTKLLRYASSPEAKERLAALVSRAGTFARTHLNLRAKLRAALKNSSRKYSTRRASGVNGSRRLYITWAN